MAVGFVPCEQRFLSCMAFSVYKVVRVACLSCSSNSGGGGTPHMKVVGMPVVSLRGVNF